MSDFELSRQVLWLQSISDEKFTGLCADNLMFAIAVKTIAEQNKRPYADILEFLEMQVDEILGNEEISDLRERWIKAFCDTPFFLKGWYSETISELLNEPEQIPISEVENE